MKRELLRLTLVVALIGIALSGAAGTAVADEDDNCEGAECYSPDSLTEPTVMDEDDNCEDRNCLSEDGVGTAPSAVVASSGEDWCETTVGVRCYDES